MKPMIYNSVRIIAMTLVFCLPMLFPSTGLQSQNVVLRMDTVTGLQGDSVTVPVYASDFNNIGSFTFFISFSGSVLKFGRVLNLNPALSQGVFLSNGSTNQVAAMWADPGGVNLGNDKLFDLRFKYSHGSTLLQFTNSCEITDIQGNPVSPSPLYLSGYVTRKLTVTIQADPPDLCFGDSTQLSFSTLGGLSTPSFFWSSSPEGFSSTLTNPVVSPGNSTYYQIMVTDGHDTATASLLVTVYFFQNPTVVENMTPEDGATNLSLPLLFSWSPSANASQYDLYVWLSTDPVPASPLVPNITQISYLVSSFLQYGKTYSWKVVAKNPCIQTESPSQTFTVRDLPDLIVTSINTPSQAYSGQTINIDFEVKNVGDGGTQTSQWYDMVYLSTDTTLETDVDYYVGAYVNMTYLNPQEAYTQNISFPLPQGISGYYYLLVWTDKNNQLLETSNTNNLSHNADTMLVTLSPVPDLRISKIVVQNSAFSGNPVSVTWTVRNYGQASTGAGHWRDRVYFSQDTVFNASAVNLGTFTSGENLLPDSTFEMTKTVTIPNYIYGRYFFYIVADIYNEIYEHALENNNRLRSDSITIFLTPPPDLVTTSVLAPMDVSVNQSVTIEYTVQNQGANPVSAYWWDRVYLTNSLNLNTNTAFLLDSKHKHLTLQPDDYYQDSFIVKIPTNISGPYYFFVFTDAKLDIFEHNQEENNIKRCSHVSQVLTPDLMVPVLMCPDTIGSGKQVAVSYYSKNQGAGSLIGSWTDKLYLSSSPVFSEATSSFVGNLVTQSVTVAPGDSLLRQGLITVPNGIEGPYYLFVVSDYHQTVFEPSHEDNNITRVELPVIVQLTPWPDLEPVSVVISPDPLTPGFQFGITYTIRNNGPGDLTGIKWYETFYLTHYQNITQHIVYQFNVEDSLHLMPDSSFTRTITATLPAYIASNTYYWYIKADAGNQVYEHIAENNNLLSSSQLFCEPYPPVDMVGTGLNTVNAAFSGTNINVGWEGKNEGMAVSLANYWSDYLYLSADTLASPDSDINLDHFVHSGILAPGSSYTNGQTVGIPNGLSGLYYIYVYIDKWNQNHDPDLTNNICWLRDQNGMIRALDITLTPPPDLTFSLFDCPSIGTTGQPLTINVEVTNQGAGATPSSYWFDRIYLSTDFMIDGGDHLLASIQHQGILEVGASYDTAITFFIPSWAVGNYIILARTDATDLNYEVPDEENNVTQQVINIEQPPPSDLVVTQVIPPDEAALGENLEISYTIQNVGLFPATGYMKDLVYFSADTVWDIDDLLFGSVTGTISLGPYATVNRSITSLLTGITPGEWYIIVRTDVLNNINEGNDDNNTAFSVQKLLVTVPQLPLNTWLEETMTDYVPVYFRIEVPMDLADETLLVRMLGDSVNGSNELYISFNQLPTRTTYDYAYGNPNAGNQQIIIPSLQQGTYYLMAYGSSASGQAQDMSFFARILNFQIVSVDAGEGGNNGHVTVKMTGSKFEFSMQVYLVQGETKILGEGLVFVDPSQVFVTFDLEQAATGWYDVMATKLCEGYTVLEDGFLVVEGGPPDLEVNMYYPSSARPQGIVTITIEFKNNGNTDLVAPEAILRSVALAPLSFTVQGIAAGLTELQIPFTEPNGPANILRPGMSGTIIVYAKATQGLVFILELPTY